jgi:hypothetical protein
VSSWGIVSYHTYVRLVDAISYCKRRITRACRCRMCLGNGSTCPHAHIRSSSISAKVRTVTSSFLPLFFLSLLYACRTRDIVLPFLRTCFWEFGGRGMGVGRHLNGSDVNFLFFLVHRTGVGHAGPRTRDVAPGAGPGRRHLAAVFDPILSEHRAGLAAPGARAAVCVFLPCSFPTFSFVGVRVD